MVLYDRVLRGTIKVYPPKLVSIETFSDFYYFSKRRVPKIFPNYREKTVISKNKQSLNAEWLKL